jgi:hypothetical protein
MRVACSWLAVGVLVVAVAGCGKSKNGTISTKGSGNQNNNDTGGDASVVPVKKPVKDAGTMAPAMSNPNAPIVKILEPGAASDPNKDTVITDSMLVARCEVTRSKTSSAHDVNQGAVRMKVTGPDPKQALTGVVSADTGNVFKAEFNLSMLPNGPFQLRCEADDTAEMPLTGFAVIDTLLDLGPKITIQEPQDKSAHSLMAPVLVKFQVDADPLDDSDNEAKPVDVKLDVSGQKFPVTEDSSQPGLFTTSINFDDKTLFPMAPTSAEVTVTAGSSRTPMAPTRSVRSQIMLDAEGPKIEVVSPTNGTIVRGDVVLKVTITDPSGVKQDTVIATINQDLHTLDHWAIADNTYSEQFDTRPFGSELVDLTINIKAQDKVGNESTQALMLKLDNQPPILSLDPPWVRELNANMECSDAFDPLGVASDDLSTQPDSSLYRVLIFEQGNHSPGQPLTYVAGVKDSTVRLFAQRPATPLLVDTNGDGDCDDINIKPDDGSDPPEQVNLAPLAVRGSAFYSKTSLSVGVDRNVPASFCMNGSSTTAPKLLCPAAQGLTRALAQPEEGTPTPGVYALSPTNSDTGECEGKTWQLMGVYGEGWLCLAARAEDSIGNVGVSPPLRVCLSDGVGTPPCDPAHDTPPKCTDGCTIKEPFPKNQTYLAR